MNKVLRDFAVKMATANIILGGNPNLYQSGDKSEARFLRTTQNPTGHYRRETECDIKHKNKLKNKNRRKNKAAKQARKQRRN